MSSHKHRHHLMVPFASPFMWAVVNIMLPFWIPIRIWHLIFRVPLERDHNVDHHPNNRALGPKY